jgi:hypothetical protein
MVTNKEWFEKWLKKYVSWRNDIKTINSSMKRLDSLKIIKKKECSMIQFYVNLRLCGITESIVYSEINSYHMGIRKFGFLRITVFILLNISTTEYK